MKKLLLLLLYIALVIPGFSQDGEMPIPDTTKSTKKDSSKLSNIEPSSTFISAGINATQFYSDAFINYWYDRADLSTPITNYPGEALGRVSTNFSYGNPSLSPYFSMGIELNGHKKLHHIVELSFMYLYGTYTGYTYYTASYSGFPGNEEKDYHNIWDTVQGRYTQTVLSIGYKFQPTFKHIFLSAGINCSLNTINAKENKNEETNGYWSNEFGYGYYPNAYTTGSATGSSMFVNFPLQVGAGGVIHKNNLVFEPAFYLTSCFMKGYNIYTLSFNILFPRKQGQQTDNRPLPKGYWDTDDY